MPMTFEAGPGDDRYTLHLSGSVTLDDIEAAAHAQIAAGAWGSRLLIDATYVTTVAPDWREIQELALFLRNATRHLPPRGRTVLLAPSDLVYGYARMYRSALDGLGPADFGLARTRAEAEAWLDRG